VSLNVGRRTIEYLQQNPQGQYTAREIAEWIFMSYPQECQEKKAGSQRSSIAHDSGNLPAGV
jgi:uncharacterized protein